MLLLPEEIKQPPHGFILTFDEYFAHPTEEVLGGITPDLGSYYSSQLGEEIKILFPSKDCSSFVENYDLQRNNLFDPYDCVTCAHQSLIDVLDKAQFNKLPKQSRRFTAVKSGTQPCKGNSNYNVQQSILGTGMVPESNCPSLTPTMTQEEFYQPISTVTGEDFRFNYDMQFCKVPTVNGVTASRVNLAGTLLYSPIVASVSSYGFDAEGRVTRTSENDIHDVLIVGVTDDYWLVMDSENPKGLIKFAPDYAFHYPTFGFLTLKKKPLFIKVGTSIAFLAQSGAFAGQYIGCGDGDTMLSIWGDYRKEQRVELSQWPENCITHNLFITK